MKKKYVAFFSSLCMIFTSLNPVVLASDAVELSTVSDVDYLEEEQEDVEEVINDSVDQNIDSEVLDESPIDVNENEVVIDEPENTNNDIAEFSNENAESLITTYEADDEYTALTENTNILYKYDEKNTTLYFKLADGATSEALPDLTKPNQSSWWKGTKTTANKSWAITCIDIGEGITSIGAYNFSSMGGVGLYANVKEIKLPETLTSIGNNAFDASNMQTSSQTLAEKTIDLSKVKSIGNGAFIGNKLSDIDLSSAEKIGENAFYECVGPKIINFKAQTVAIGGAAFQSCKTLSAVTAKEMNITGSLAFASCSSLQTFSCEKINQIPANTFLVSDNLKSICYAGQSEEWKNLSIDAGLVADVKVHCKADQLEAKTPTCTESGLELEDNVCGVCGEHYFTGKVLEPLGHKFSDDYTVDKVATCNEEGEKSKHCENGCGVRDDIQPIPVDKENHDWTSEVTTQPTCVKEGVRTFTCNRCKDTKTEAIPATGKHQWSDWKKTADATVFAPEQQERSCTICGKTETQTVGSKMSATATVNVSSVTLKVKQNTSSVKVTGLAKGDSVKTWKSTNTKVFKVTGKADGTCKLTGVKKGTAKLEITLASGLKKTVTVKVQAKTVKTSKISGLAKKMTVKKGTKTNLKPVITPATSQQKVTYSSSNKKVAIVSSKGVITAKKAGTAKITVKSGSKKVTVTVTVPKTKTTAITVGEKASVKKGKTYSLKAKVVPSNSDEKITYSTSNKKIATVSKSGKIKGVKKGTATITIKSGKVAKKVKVTVK